MQHSFNYDQAFARNIGWVTPAEQARLRATRVAIGGLGGVGGTYLLTLARLGVEHFTIADFDQFEIHNFNRQVGATMTTLGCSKVTVLEQMAREINPHVQVKCMTAGVTPENIDEFLSAVDVFVDGIDFFALDVRRMIFAACYARGIPALTAAPIGMGTALLYFAPNGMSFDRYFRLEGCDATEQYARFLAGLSPAMLQLGYLQVPEAVDFATKRGPSTMMACDLCAGVMGTAVLKLMLQRGTLRAAPWAMQFDAYRHKMRHTWRPWGNAHPLQRLLLYFIRAKLTA